jgi:LuxR family transcriptional regulator, maltose regulon positive regulatory protein
MLYNESMAIPVLATKLHIPPHLSKVVNRSRLMEKLNDGFLTRRNITLISAPAGFGKTTLVTEWVTSSARPAAWLSLDESDNDPARFLIYLISALQTLSPGLGAGLLDVLQSSQPSPIESLLTALLNEIEAMTDDFIFVLDDYHLTDSKSIDNALTFVVEHLPLQMHLVITTREDPSIPIPRLRARNQLVELRVADLRFTPGEAAEFLNQVMGLDLTEEDVTALETRTEGWIAGLQLAALSMKGNKDVSGFIQAFAGDHRYIVDYLVEEVLQRQPEEYRSFLLQTSILERLNGPLCDAVTLQTGSTARLEQLQRGNFFLTPLDDKRNWYRYHHLFGDVLRMHLIAEQSDKLSLLHRRASEWYEQNGSPEEAIRHALAGSDFERAAALIELAAPAMHKRREEATVLTWMKALPEEIFRDRPVLSVLYAGAIMSNGGVEGVDAQLREAEQWLDKMGEMHERPAAMIVANEEEFHRLPGMIVMYRAGLALARGDVLETVKYSRQVLDLTPEEDHLERGAAAALLGLALWTQGDLEPAYQSFAEGMAHLQRAGNISDAVGGVLALADIRIDQGRLRDAMRIYEGALQLAKQHGTPTLRGTADMYVGMSELEREHNNLTAATQYLLRSQEQGEHTGFPQHPYRWRVVMARLREVEGDLDGALELLDEAERLYVSDFFPNVRPIGALKVRLWIAKAQLDKTLEWTREQGLSTNDTLAYLHEFEHITLARILLADHRSDGSESSVREAAGLLERLLKAAEEGDRMGSAIEILILLALARQRQGDLPAALRSLERALRLAEPEGYLRIFLDEGADMAQLVREAAVQGIMPGYTSRLLPSFAAEQSEGGEAPRTDSPASSSLVEPLSQRELEVLRLFKTELSGPEIARELVVALSTVRTHTKSIYSKLNVNSRRAAVKRAEELGLI